MEAWDGCYSMGTSDNSKFLVIQQNLETKLNEKLFYVSSTVELRNVLDINKTQYDLLISKKYLDHNDYRYVIMFVPYWMEH